MRILLLAAIVAGAVGASSPAHALSCVQCSSLFTPEGGAYPSNLELRVMLIQPDVVPRAEPDTFGGFECEAIEGVDDMAVVCKPRQTPAPGSYSLTNFFHPFEGSAVTIDVGANADDEAPEAPTVHRVKWNDFDGDLFTRGHIELIIDTTDPTAAGAEIEIRRPDGEVVFVATRPLGSREGVARFRINLSTTESACSCMPVFDSDNLPSNSRLRVRLVDRAGNRSAWSEVVEPADSPSCTCVRMPGAGGVAGWWLALLMIAALRISAPGSDRRR